VKHGKLPIVSNEASTNLDNDQRKRLTRRQAMQTLFSGVGAALSLPALASAHPVRRHLTSMATMEQADQKAAGAAWKPEFLTATQNQTLVAIAERMVPGSTQAQVNRIIDLLLSVDTPGNQKNFTASLSTLDQESDHKYRKLFSGLSPQQQDEVLTVSASGKEGPSNTTSADPDEPEPEKILVTKRDHFENLKGWIVGAYYSTEIGMRELDWTEDFYFEELPGCPHGGEHAPDTTAEHQRSGTNKSDLRDES
jgi:hypothetical protein